MSWTCPRCKGKGVDPVQDPNDYPMGAVNCGLCNGTKVVHFPKSEYASGNRLGWTWAIE